MLPRVHAQILFDEKISGDASKIDERPVNKCRRLKDRENENREGEVLDSISTSASQTRMRGQKKKMSNRPVRTARWLSVSLIGRARERT